VIAAFGAAITRVHDGLGVEFYVLDEGRDRRWTASFSGKIRHLREDGGGGGSQAK